MSGTTGTKDRVYLVTIGERDRLVRATHPSTALQHVARDIASVKVASQQDLIDCLADGVKVEYVGAEQQQLAGT